MPPSRWIRTLCVAVASACLAQESQPEKRHLGDEKHIQGMMKHHGIVGQKAKYGALGQTEIESLTPLLTWLEGRFGRRNTKLQADAPLRSIDEPLEVVTREDENSKIYNGIMVHVLLTAKIEGAGRAAAFHLTQVQLPFEKGSFSGLPVGDWTAKNLWGGRPALVFTRKNAFVRVRCQKAIEITKSDKSTRGIADPGVIDMCEAFARDIDAQLERLPSRKM